MTGAEIMLVLMFLALFAGILSGIPAMLAIAGMPLALAFIGAQFGLFNLTLLNTYPARVWGVMTNTLLMAVPLFVLMGVLLERSGLAERMLRVLARLMGGSARGMALSVLAFSTIIAASTGIIGATIVMLVLIALGPMMSAGVGKRQAAGLITASGTLGQIVPPSIVLVLLGDQIGNTYVEAQQRAGNFAPQAVSVADLFAGALVPSLLLVGLYALWLLVSLRPAKGAVPPPRQPVARREILFTFLPPLLLILAVLGSIVAGIATPTESAALGVAGAFLLALFTRKLSLRILRETSVETARTTAMILFVMMGATLFSVVFRRLGGDAMIVQLFGFGVDQPYLALFTIMALVFILGFFLDWIEISLVVIPIIAPVVLTLDFGLPREQVLIWFAIALAVNLQTSFLTPPFGHALFYLRSVVPDLPMGIVYRGIVPFVAIQLVVVVLTVVFPQIAMWLPGMMGR